MGVLTSPSYQMTLSLPDIGHSIPRYIMTAGFSACILTRVACRMSMMAHHIPAIALQNDYRRRHCVNVPIYTTPVTGSRGTHHIFLAQFTRTGIGGTRTDRQVIRPAPYFVCNLPARSKTRRVRKVCMRRSRCNKSTHLRPGICEGLYLFRSTLNVVLQ